MGRQHEDSVGTTRFEAQAGVLSEVMDRAGSGLAAFDGFPRRGSRLDQVEPVAIIVEPENLIWYASGTRHNNRIIAYKISLQLEIRSDSE